LGVGPVAVDGERPLDVHERDAEEAGAGEVFAVLAAHGQEPAGRGQARDRGAGEQVAHGGHSASARERLEQFVVVGPQAEQAERRHARPASLDDHVARGDGGGGAERPQGLDLGAQFVGVQAVVGVDPRDVRAARGGGGDVARRAGPPLGAREYAQGPPGRGGATARAFDGVVGAAVVDQQDFEGVVRLGEARRQARLDGGGRVVRGDADGHQFVGRAHAAPVAGAPAGASSPARRSPSSARTSGPIAARRQPNSYHA
jgi:hypothetical protein